MARKTMLNESIGDGGYVYDDSSDQTRGTMHFLDGTTARIEDCLPAASILQKIYDTAIEKYRQGSPERTFLLGVLKEVREFAGGDRNIAPTDPMRLEQLNYALNCGWLAGESFNLSDDGETLTVEAKMMAKMFLYKRGDQVMFGAAQREIEIVKGKDLMVYQSEDAIDSPIDFDLPPFDDLLEKFPSIAHGGK